MEQDFFEELAESLVVKNENVAHGKMMSCPGVIYKKKVFCFFYGEKMVFKLGKGYDIEKYGITEYTYLNPFKNKGPMIAWFEVESKYKDKWEILAEKALENMINEIG